MKVQKIELFIVAFLPHALQHHHMQRVGITHGTIQTQGFGPSGVEFSRRLGIAAGEQRDVVAQCNEFLGEPVHHPLGAAVQFGGDGLRQRGDLRDAHICISCVECWLNEALSP